MERQIIVDGWDQVEAWSHNLIYFIWKDNTTD
jgi:hypothetical protein